MSTKKKKPTINKQDPGLAVDLFQTGLDLLREAGLSFETGLDAEDSPVIVFSKHHFYLCFSCGRFSFGGFGGACNYPSCKARAVSKAEPGTAPEIAAVPILGTPGTPAGDPGTNE